jgi:hypothetical protein
LCNLESMGGTCWESSPNWILRSCHLRCYRQIRVK